MADILVLAFFGLARLDRLGGIAALENLHSGFFIGTDDQAAFLVETQRLKIELTDIIGLGFEVGIMAVEPVDAPMRLEVGLFQDAPDTGAAYGLQPMLGERGDQVVQTPPGGGTMIRRRLPGRPRQDVHALSGGKRAAGDPSAGPLAGAMVALARRCAGSTDSETPRLEGWNGHAPTTPNGRVPPV